MNELLNEDYQKIKWRLPKKQENLKKEDDHSDYRSQIQQQPTYLWNCILVPITPTIQSYHNFYIK